MLTEALVVLHMPVVIKTAEFPMVMVLVRKSVMFHLIS